ncbi:VPLPA-CTERM sorting domain-containing protein [Meridianimarinicoccus aquatilis]|uniref:VPLPA-CTERM sorting domain-containing protein n=1 Tax=Meridianimarinicoccus aquatilis TaxID=2552766 RepID=A0A4R6AP24_9RHOB|nr:VPLPA-CTERM sorting domain-containing protein [Fluviibacterium aquatile]TDL85507.1 VPLPA-CTERM sorting domain-containing protein [Fluviibacterium aquatile]
MKKDALKAVLARTAGVLATLLWAAGTADAATLTVGPVSFPQGNLADIVRETNGVIGNPGKGAIIDGFLDSSATLDEGETHVLGDEDAFAVQFSAGAVVNVSGPDIYIFQLYGASNLMMSLGSGTAGSMGTLLGVANGAPASVTKYPFLTRDIFVFGYDLDSVGGARSVSGEIHFRYVGPDPAYVTGVAAVALSTTPAAPVPVPASLPMLLAGLGGLLAFGRRTRLHARATQTPR